MNISIVGGDLRVVRLAQMYAKEGKKVYIYGLEEYFKKNENDNIIIYEDLKETLEKSNIIISGMPFSKDGVNINTPFFKKIIKIEELRNRLEEKIFIAGGIPKKFYEQKNKNFDLLENEKLTILNAILTVEGTIKIAIEEREESIFESNVMICGFGRIGKILCDRFSSFGAKIYCVARKESDLTWIRKNRYIPITYDEIKKYASKIDILINTVPNMVIDKEKLKSFDKKVLMIDVASNPGGIDKEYANQIGIKVITALGIPGKEMPLTSAKYIKEIIDGYNLRIIINSKQYIFKNKY